MTESSFACTRSYLATGLIILWTTVTLVGSNSYAINLFGRSAAAAGNKCELALVTASDLDRVAISTVIQSYGSSAAELAYVGQMLPELTPAFGKIGTVEKLDAKLTRLSPEKLKLLARRIVVFSELMRIVKEEGVSISALASMFREFDPYFFDGRVDAHHFFYYVGRLELAPLTDLEHKLRLLPMLKKTLRPNETQESLLNRYAGLWHPETRGSLGWNLSGPADYYFLLLVVGHTNIIGVHQTIIDIQSGRAL